MERQLVDFHAHILPGADHGSRDPQTAKKQLEILGGAGVTAVVATPHFYPQRDNVESFLERRERAAAQLADLCESGCPSVYPGAEVLVCPGMDHMPGLERLCIEGTRVLLLEMPFGVWSDAHIDTVAKICRRGFTVVMAHIDRYFEKDVRRLASECKVCYQLNGETQATLKGRKKAVWLAEGCNVAAVGSDIHGPDKTAAKNLVKLAKKLERKHLYSVDRSLELLEGANSII